MRPQDFVMWTHSYVFDKELDIRASSQIAHLTYNRERPEEKTRWKIEQWFAALRKPSVAFLKAVALMEPLMAYHANKTRTEELLKILPRI